MDSVYNDIRSRLHRYGTAVSETRSHAGERSSFGRYRAGAPYFEQYPLRAALREAVATGVTLPEEFCKEYDRTTQELAAPDLEGSRAYREELYRDLVSCIEVYRTAISFHELGTGSLSDLVPPSLRQEIGILLCELKKDFSLGDLECEVGMLDAALRSDGSEVQPGTGDMASAEGYPDAVAGYPVLVRKKGRAGAR
jgi:hypothetical protein